jgi:thiol-disulfide isomerase/thioredoxin
MKLFMVIVVVVAFAMLLLPSTHIASARLPLEGGFSEKGDHGYVGGGCLSEKCLVVYVAPWCPTCRKLAPAIEGLVNDVKRDGYSTAVVVGKDNEASISNYAEKFSFSVLTDVNGAYYRKLDLKGVPYFAVTDSQGKLLQDLYGGYSRVSDLRRDLDI